jgi:hypothetical protein
MAIRTGVAVRPDMTVLLDETLAELCLLAGEVRVYVDRRSRAVVATPGMTLAIAVAIVTEGLRLSGGERAAKDGGSEGGGLQRGYHRGLQLRGEALSRDDAGSMPSRLNGISIGLATN